MGTAKASAEVLAQLPNDESHREADEIRQELITELRDRARIAEESARKAEEAAKRAEDRAERYETDLAELRRKHDELTTRLLTPPPKPGLFARLFGK